MHRNVMIVVALWLSLGCAPAGLEVEPEKGASPDDKADDFDPPAETTQGRSLPIPLHRQATDYSCGAASLFSVLTYWQAFDGGEQQLYEPLGTDPETGTEPDSIVTVARSFGLEAEARTELEIADLDQALARGQTVIVNLQAWHGDQEPGFTWVEDYDDGHYVVLAGIEGSRVTFMDPWKAGRYVYLSVDELRERWHDVGYDRLAIFIHGNRAPLEAAPAAPVRME